MSQSAYTMHGKGYQFKRIGTRIGFGAFVLAISSIGFAQGKGSVGKKGPEPAKTAEQAPPPPPPPAEPQCDKIADNADRLVCQGRQLAGKGDFQGAYPLFLKAWYERKSYDIAGNLALMELKLGKLREAAEHFLYCEQNYPSVKDPELVKKLETVKKFSEEARGQVGMVTVRVVRDDGKSAVGADVLLDGQAIARVGADGMAEHTLLGPGKPLFAEPGSRTVSAKVSCSAEKEATDSVTVVVQKGGTSNATLTLSCREEFPLWPALVVGGVGVIGAGGGVASLIISGKKKDEAADLRAALEARDGASACLDPANAADCDKMDSAEVLSRNLKTVSIAGFVVGGVGLIAGGVLGYLHFKSTAAPEAALGPVRLQAAGAVMPGGGGIWVQGRF